MRKTKKAAASREARDISELWWWGYGSIEEVSKGMELALDSGEAVPLNFKGYFLEYVRGAFCYELEARKLQSERGSKSPIWRYERPFPEISKSQKDALRAEFPSMGWQPLPRNIGEYPAEDEALPNGWVDIHFWVDPESMDRNLILEAISEYYDKMVSRLEVERRINSGLRKKPYPWAALALVDRKLAGEPLVESDRANANNVLRRSY